MMPPYHRSGTTSPLGAGRFPSAPTLSASAIFAAVGLPHPVGERAGDANAESAWLRWRRVLRPMIAEVMKSGVPSRTSSRISRTKTPMLRRRICSTMAAPSGRRGRGRRGAAPAASTALVSLAPPRRRAASPPRHRYVRPCRRTQQLGEENHVLQDSAASPAMGCGASARRADRAVAGDAIPRLQRADMIFGYSRPVPAQPLIAACWRRAGTIRSANLCNRASPTDGLLRGRALGPCRGRSNPYDGDPVGRLRSQQPIGPLFARPRERATAARVRLGDQYRQSSLAFAGDTGSSLRRN